MIPLRLHLKNFLSYGADLQAIDFEPYHLICLSGKNGHGKSALLDAMTWAIWGQARKQSGTAKADEGLLRLGQKQMIVILDFIFNGQAYRIRREFTLTHGKPYAVLEFGILNQATESITPLTDKTIRETQEKINQMLGIDYDSFINSAFLRQGQANEFSKKSPKERKAILAQIIGLDRFESLKKIAHELVRAQQQEKGEYLKLVQHLDQELEKTDEIISLMQVVQKELIALTQAEELLKKEFTCSEHEKKQLASQQQAYALARQQVEQLAQEHAHHQETFYTTAQQWRATNQQIVELGRHASLEPQKKVLIATINTHQKALQASITLNKEILSLRENHQKIATQINATHTEAIVQKKGAIELLLAQKKAFSHTIDHLEQERKKNDRDLQLLTKRIDEEQKSITAYKGTEHLQQTEKKFEKKRNYYHTWVERANVCAQKKHEIERKKQLSSDQDQAASCPLCEQNLSASRKRFLMAKFDAEYALITHQLTRLTNLLKTVKEVLLLDHKKIEQYKKDAQAHSVSQVTLAELETNKKAFLNKQQDQLKQQATYTAQMQTIDTSLAHEHASLQKLLKEQENFIEMHPELKTITQKIMEYSAQITALPVQEEQYQAALKDLEQIEQRLKDYEQFERQKPLQDQRKKTVFHAAHQARIIHKKLTTQKELLNNFSVLEKNTIRIEEKFTTLETQRAELAIKKDTLLQEKGRLNAYSTKLKQYQEERAQHQNTINALIAQIDEYQIIATALGKDGIQALLIEDVIPEIEQEANELLAKLTENQAQIFIESLRDLKKGGTKETLDIKISDAV
ncbi:MAG: SMC family ATPase, partial [Candidatus Babeliales bacterium]